MDHYHVWCDLRPGVKDMDFASAVAALLGHMQHQGLLAAYRLSRRKLGFGPAELGEWHVDMEVRDLAHLQEAFDHVTPRTGEVEALHAAVWSKVTNFRSGLYRDFPDANRAR